jgi:hypothetical protein
METLARGVAEALGGTLETDEMFYHLTAPVVGEDDEEVDPDHTETVTLYLEGEAEDLVVVYCEAGPFSTEVDLAAVLRGLKDAAFSRVYITDPDDEGTEGLAVEAAVLREGVTVAQLSEIVQEVINVADFLEDVIEGGQT